MYNNVRVVMRIIKERRETGYVRVPPTTTRRLVNIVFRVSTNAGHQEFSSRALVTLVPIMLLLLGPLFLVLICVGYRVFVRTKKAEYEINAITRVQ